MKALFVHAVVLLVLFAGLAGCAAESRRLPAAREFFAQVADAPEHPVELSDPQKQQVSTALMSSRSGAARRFIDDPDLGPQIWGSFWRSPLTSQVDRDRLILVRYAEDGSYVYVGFTREGLLFTDGAGPIGFDPPWSQ